MRASSLFRDSILAHVCSHFLMGLHIQSATQAPTSTHTHTQRHTYVVVTARATTTSCGHISARLLLMGNHHGNQCHIMSSRSPGSLPSPFFSFPQRKEKRRDVEKRWNRKVQLCSIDESRKPALSDWYPGTQGLFLYPIWFSQILLLEHSDLFAGSLDEYYLDITFRAFQCKNRPACAV